MVIFKKLFKKEPIIDTVVETLIHRTCPFGYRMPYGFYSVPAETGSSHCVSCSQYVKHDEKKITCVDNGDSIIPTKIWKEELNEISNRLGIHL